MYCAISESCRKHNNLYGFSSFEGHAKVFVGADTASVNSFCAFLGRLTSGTRGTILIFKMMKSTVQLFLCVFVIVCGVSESASTRKDVRMAPKPTRNNRRVKLTHNEFSVMLGHLLHLYGVNVLTSVDPNSMTGKSPISIAEGIQKLREKGYQIDNSPQPDDAVYITLPDDGPDTSDVEVSPNAPPINTNPAPVIILQQTSAPPPLLMETSIITELPPTQVSMINADATKVTNSIVAIVNSLTTEESTPTPINIEVDKLLSASETFTVKDKDPNELIGETIVPSVPVVPTVLSTVAIQQESVIETVTVDASPQVELIPINQPQSLQNEVVVSIQQAIIPDLPTTTTTTTQRPPMTYARPIPTTTPQLPPKSPCPTFTDVAQGSSQVWKGLVNAAGAKEKLIVLRGAADDAITTLTRCAQKLAMQLASLVFGKSQEERNEEPERRILEEPHTDDPLQWERESNEEPQRESGEKFQTESKEQLVKESNEEPHKESYDIPQKESIVMPPPSESNIMPQNENNAMPLPSESNIMPQNENNAMPLPSESKIMPQNENNAMPLPSESNIILQKENDVTLVSSGQPQTESTVIFQKESDTDLNNENNKQSQKESNVILQTESNTVFQTLNNEQPLKESNTVLQKDSSVILQTLNNEQPPKESNTVLQKDSSVVLQTLNEQPQKESNTVLQNVNSEQPLRENKVLPQKTTNTISQRINIGKSRVSSNIKTTEGRQEPGATLDSIPKDVGKREPQATTSAPKTDATAQESPKEKQVVSDGLPNAGTTADLDSIKSSPRRLRQQARRQSIKSKLVASNHRRLDLKEKNPGVEASEDNIDPSLYPLA